MPTDGHEHKYLSELIIHDRGFVLDLPEVLLNRDKNHGHVCTLIKAIYSLMYLTSDKTYEALFGGCMFSVVEVN